MGGLAPFAYNGAALIGITQPVVMDAVAQFQFNAAGAGQAIDLPFGEQDAAPEPATFALIGSGLLALGFFRWKKA